MVVELLWVVLAPQRGPAKRQNSLMHDRDGQPYRILLAVIQCRWVWYWTFHCPSLGIILCSYEVLDLAGCELAIARGALLQCLTLLLGHVLVPVWLPNT